MKIASSISPKSNYTVAGLKIEGTGSEILRSRQTKSSPHLCSSPPKRNEPDRDGDGETETEREREGGREGERARAVQRFLTFPRPLISTGSKALAPRRHRYRDGQPAKSHPGEDKNERGGEDRGNYWQCERRNLFYILAPPPFVLSRPPKKIGRDVARIPYSQFEFSTIFPLLSSPSFTPLG